MAIDENKKGAILAAIATGTSISEASRRFKVGKATIKSWVDRGHIQAVLPGRKLDLPNALPRSEKKNRTPQKSERADVQEVRRYELQEAFDGALLEIMLGLKAIGRVLQDEDWVKRKPDGANELAQTAFTAAHSLVSQLAEPPEPKSEESGVLEADFKEA